MAFNVKISINADEYNRELQLAEKQVKFATALALGMTAGNGKVGAVKGRGGAREDLKGSLKRYFTVRGKKATGGWMGKSMRSTRANKRNLWAEVGTIDENLADHITGATRRSPKGEAVPAIGRGLGRPTKEHRTTKARWAGSQIKKDMQKQPGARNLFVIKSGANKLVMKKVGPLKKRERMRGTSPRVRRTSVRGRGGDAKVMWSIAPDIRLKVRWPFKRLVQLSVMRHWEANADAAFSYAWKTRN